MTDPQMPLEVQAWGWATGREVSAAGEGWYRSEGGKILRGDACIIPAPDSAQWAWDVVTGLQGQKTRWLVQIDKDGVEILEMGTGLTYDGTGPDLNAALLAAVLAAREGTK